MRRQLKHFYRIIAVSVLTALMILAVGCGESQDSGKDSYMGKPFDNEFDMCAVINGVTYEVRKDSARVLEVLGNEYDYSEVVSCVYEGYDKTFSYEGISVCTVPVDGVDIIEQFIIKGEGYYTPRNISVGSTREEVFAAYGEDYFDDGYVTYTESNNQSNITEMRIQFYIVDDIVEEIYIYSPSY